MLAGVRVREGASALVVVIPGCWREFVESANLLGGRHHGVGRHVLLDPPFVFPLRPAQD
jgi:hypothetical protein